jgi:hypothetical protein
MFAAPCGKPGVKSPADRSCQLCCLAKFGTNRFLSIALRAAQSAADAARLAPRWLVGGAPCLRRRVLAESREAGGQLRSATDRGQWPVRRLTARKLSRPTRRCDSKRPRPKPPPANTLQPVVVPCPILTFAVESGFRRRRQARHRHRASTLHVGVQPRLCRCPELTVRGRQHPPLAQRGAQARPCARATTTSILCDCFSLAILQPRLVSRATARDTRQANLSVRILRRLRPFTSSTRPR